MPLQAISEQFNNPFMTLRNRNYKIYWSAMSISSIGIWMQSTAQPWLAYSMTDSPLLLSIVSSLQFLPVFLFSLFAGVLIDRFPKKKLLILSQTLSAILSLCMFLLLFSQRIQFWHVLLIAALMGTVNVVNYPLRQVFINDLVNEDCIMNAVALYNTAFNFFRIVGPALAGLIMAYFGIGICYLINGVTFLVAVAGLLFIKTITPVAKPSNSHAVIADAKEGLNYVLKNQRIRDIVFVLAATGTFAINFSVLLPVLSRVLGQSEIGYGSLMSTVGIGTFFGAFTIAASSKKGPSKHILFKAPLIISVMLLVIAFSQQHYFIYIALALIGFFYVAFTSTASSALQLYAPSAYIGRIMSIYNLVLIGTSPLGNLYSGAVANHFGASWAFFACGSGVFICYGIYYFIKLFPFSKKGVTGNN